MKKRTRIAKREKPPVPSVPQDTKIRDVTDRMLAFIVKQSSQPKTRQIIDPFEHLYTAGGAIEPPLPPEKMLILTEENAVHQAAVNAKAIDSVGRGYDFESIKEDEEAAPQTADDLRKKLEELTPDLTFMELLIQAGRELEGIGWAVWEIVREKDGTIGSIFPMPSHTLRATIDPQIFIQQRGALFRYFKKFGSEINLDLTTGKVAADVPEERQASEVLVFKTYSPRTPYYGIPTWVAAISSIAELTSIREFNVSWFQSSGQADRSMHVTAKDIAHAEKVVQDLQMQLEDVRGHGHTNILTFGGEDVKLAHTQLGQPIKEGHFQKRRLDLVKEILMAHQVPPYRIGLAELGSLGGSAAKEMLNAYRYGAIEPIQTVFEDRLNQTLFGEKGLRIQGLRFKLKEVVFEQEELDLNFATSTVGAGILTPNQAREVLGRPKVEDKPELDEHYFGGTRVGEAAPAAFREEGLKVLEEFSKALRAAVDGPGEVMISDNGRPGTEEVEVERKEGDE